MLLNPKKLPARCALLSFFMVGTLMAESASISGEAIFPEHVVLPPNTIFKATLDDTSLMDVPSVTLGSTTASPATQLPISFNIKYNTDDLTNGHRYNVRARITVNGKLLFITDTSNPVLNGGDDSNLQLIMKRVASSLNNKVSPFSGFPVHFLGLLPGANCQSQYQLDLFSNNAYFVRNRCYKNGESIDADDIGRWHFNTEMNLLTLKGGREAPLLFTVLDKSTIEKLDISGNKINSELNYKLKTSDTAQILEPDVFMQGMYQYAADAAIFKECTTGLRLPVLFENENRALENAYIDDKKEPGALLKVYIEGKIVQRPKIDGEGYQAHLLVKHFIKTIPNEQCGNQYVDASFSNTYWKLTSLYNENARTKPNKRETHIIFRAPDDGKGAFKGVSGCNTMFGNYKVNDKDLTITLNQVAMTRMSCVNDIIEERFLLALEDAAHWKIKGDHLELLDSTSKKIARFEAVYF